jgi:hypothetical protein
MPKLTTKDLSRSLLNREPLGPKAAGTLEIDAETLGEFALECTSAFECVSLHSVTIQGSLDLSFHRVAARLVFDDCRFAESLDLRETHVAELAFAGCSFEGLFLGAGLHTDYGLRFSDTRAKAPVVLSRARISGALDFSRAEFGEPSSPWGLSDGLPFLSLDDATIDGSVIFDDSVIHGGITMMRAEISGDLFLNRARMTRPKPGHHALAAAGMHVSGTVMADGLWTTGPIALVAARLDTNFLLSHAKLEGGDRGDGTDRALSADGIRVGSDIRWSQLTAAGEVRMIGGQVAGQLVISDSHLESLKGRRVTLHGDRLVVSEGVTLESTVSLGEVRMVGANIRGQFLVRAIKIDVRSGSSPVQENDALSLDEGRISESAFISDSEFHGPLRIPGCAVGGDLSLARCRFDTVGATSQAVEATNLQVGRDLSAPEIELRGGFSLSGSQIGGNLRMNSSRLSTVDPVRTPVLSLDRCRVAGSIILSESHFYGEVRLRAATIGVQMIFERGVVESVRNVGDGFSLTADRASFLGSAYFTETRFIGEVRLIGANIAGQLGFTRARLEGRELSEGDALSLDGATIAGGIFCRDLRAHGCIRFPRAKIGAHADFSGSVVESFPGKDDCLVGEGVNAEAVLDFTRARLRGRINLASAKIQGRLMFRISSLSGGGAKNTLSLSLAHIDDLVLMPQDVVGPVDFSGVEIGSLSDARGGRFRGQPPAEIELEGATYSLPEPLDAHQRLKWIGGGSNRYSPGTHQELARAFRQAGKAGEARKVLMAGERRARSQYKRLSVRGIWQDFLWITVGNGYRNSLAALWLVGLITLGTIAVAIGKGSFQPLRPIHPDFNPTLYAIDVTVPILDLGQQSSFTASGVEAWVTLTLSVAGYALAAALIASATRLFSREQ